MATKAKTDVAVQQPVAVAMFSDQTPEWAKGQQARGSENVGSKDIVLPRLEIVQSESPIKEENDEAVDGMLFNTVTQEVIGTETFVIPIYYRVEYIVWKSKKTSDGGFFGAYDTEGEALARKAEEVNNGLNPDDVEVVDTPVHYCLRVKPDMTFEQIVVSMPKSKAKVSRKWNAVIQLCGGDRFSRAYKLSTFKDKNKQGKTFQNYIVQPAGFPPESLYREAERLYNVFKTQGVKADHASGGTGEDETPTEI